MNKVTQKLNHPKTQSPNAPTSQLRIVFLGTPDFIEPVIDTLNKNFDLVKIIRKPQDLNDEAIQSMKELSPDLFVVAAFGKILTSEVLDIPKLGAINIHPSLLPIFRGSTPIQTAILKGYKETGVSIIKMDEKMDHGPILEQFEEPILPNDTFETLSKRLFKKSTDPLVNVIEHINEIKPKIQDEKKATFTKILSKEDGFIDIDNPPSNDMLKRMIRSYHPWPGTWTRSSIINHKSLIIKFLPDHRIQVEGKKPMNYNDFINGYTNGEKFLRKINLIPN